MRKVFLAMLIFGMLFLFTSVTAEAQCSICTRTAQQLGEKPARGLNAGILYLAFTPLALIGTIAFYWYRKQRTQED